MQTQEGPLAIESARDGSEIRVLLRGVRGQLAFCTLAAGQTSAAHRHQTIEEIWHCTSGRGEVWRKRGNKEMVVPFHPGVSLDIPPGTDFQFRNTGNEPLTFVIATMPPWPGNEEAVRVSDHWTTSMST